MGREAARHAGAGRSPAPVTSTVPCSAGRPPGTPAAREPRRVRPPAAQRELRLTAGQRAHTVRGPVGVDQHEVAGLLGAQPAPHRRGGEVRDVRVDDADGAAQDDEVGRAAVTGGQLGPAQLAQRVRVVLAQLGGGGEDEFAVRVVGVDPARP